VSGQWWITSTVEKNSERERHFHRPATFIVGEERELEAGPSCWCQTPTLCWADEPSARTGFPYSQSDSHTTQSVWSWPGPLFHWVGPNSLNQTFFYFPNWPKFVNNENHHSVAPKISNLWNLIKCMMRNNFPFSSKLKFETELELQILEAELLWIWAKFIGGPNLFGKIQ
jgi:hypothetical protein